jgi:type I restriction enzyme R subunit
MSEVGDIEKVTQERVKKLFNEQLGYSYLGDWKDRPGNSNIEETILLKYLQEKKGYPAVLANKAVYELTTAAKDLSDGLYAANKKVYGMLRYGVKVKTEAGENYETVHLIDWQHPLNNEFAIAEEVTIIGQHDKRPDIVLYVNGIALGVLELKRSTISIEEGVRQNITNQKKEFIQSFFSTVQWVMAGSDTQGLRYGTILTKEKYYLKWKEPGDVANLLDKYLRKLCDKQRFLEIIYDFILFDGGIKKLCRTHQYFGVKAAQEYVKMREGGIIWHTQGSGKSLVMVWLAKWILEYNPAARVVIITDRDELDKQIERVFTDAGEKIKRTSSGKDLMEQLGQPLPRLLCSLVHKFGKKDIDNFDAFIEELKQGPSQTFGELFIFVDECHRTQSGKLHKTMNAILKNAVFIGFTGTPLLKKDKETSLEVFGNYIHTYKFNEAVADEVVLDMIYEARDIDQKLTSQQKVDEWFEIKTKGLNEFQKSALKKKWGTMQKVLGSYSRLEKIVSDIVYDFAVKPRLNSGSGNALLVASSIYEACRYYELFQKTELKGKCAIVTSYNPAAKDITTEDTGANTETEREFIYNTYKALLGEKSTEKYEDEAKAKFTSEPANMKLLVVVDKLLVGFDAPPCTYLYIDKSMQDHGLFQAICRVNRLDKEDKQFGYIVDYKDLFKKVENAVAVYTSELDYDNFKKEDVDVLLKDRLDKGRERLEKALEEIALLCEPVEPPKDLLAYIRYFCGDPENEAALKETETRRAILYKQTVALIRAFANIAGELEEAGYSQMEIQDIKKKVDFYLNLRDSIKNASGEVLDMKTYEADMRHLIDTYIQAEESKVISPFKDMPLLDIIVKSGIAAAITSLPAGIKKNQEAIAETIINNVRKKIIEDHLLDPIYFEKMSYLLNEIIKERKTGAINYQEYLNKIAELAGQVNQPAYQGLPPDIKTKGQIALYHNLGNNKDLALKIDNAVKKVKKADWRGNTPKENEIRAELLKILQVKEEVEKYFAIIEQQKEY